MSYLIFILSIGLLPVDTFLSSFKLYFLEVLHFQLKSFGSNRVL